MEKIGTYREIAIETSLSAFEVFKRLYPHYGDVYLLESLGEEGKYNRFSYVGFSPDAMIVASGKNFIINGKSISTKNPYASLGQFFSSHKQKGQGFHGGLVGFMSYEGTRYVEGAFKGCQNHDFPEFQFGLFLDGLIFDKKGKKCIYFYHGKNRMKDVLRHISTPQPLGTFSHQKLSNRKDEKTHKYMVETAKEEIKKGNIFQVVLSLKSHYRLTGDHRRIYALLRQINPSPYMSYLKFGDREILSASPELLIRVKGRDLEHFGTLAGTIRRGKSEQEDEQLAQTLKVDEKERAEHMMLVDLARNDVGRVCEFGSVKVEKLASVKRFRYVQHLYSEIYGKLKKKEDCFSALAACFPAGTLTGAPKIEAMKIIHDLEGEARGPYGGVIGYVSLSGDAMFSIAIRSLFIKGDNAYTQTGSGIVLDSEAKKEYQEIVNKQKGMEEALKKAQSSKIKTQKYL